MVYYLFLYFIIYFHIDFLVPKYKANEERNLQNDDDVKIIQRFIASSKHL